ncbi:MAG: beta-galactosidase, partial [Anaerolineae bacterium]|nr:beta-galactosidase [Anaerolineae bacterium]
MLYPQINHFRQVIDLSGFWDFRFDDEETSTPIAVPASWNEQVHDDGGRNRRDDLGPAWYETHFELPAPWAGQRIMLRFGSVNYLAEVWLNGTRLGAHEGGHLPFEFDVTAQLHPENNHLVARVDGNLAFDRVPPGNVTGDAADFFESHADNYPQAQFDFFPFCGIHRPVLLYTLPPVAITDLTVTTDIAGTTGRVRVRMTCTEWDDHKAVRARFVLQGQGAALQIAVPLDG